MRLTLAIVMLGMWVGLVNADVVAPKPSITMGDRWVYRSYRENVQAETYELRVSFANNSAIHTVLIVKDFGDLSTSLASRTISGGNEAKRETDSTWTPEWNAVSSGSGAVYASHSGTFQFPLAVGRRYRADYEMHRPREEAARWKHERTAKVVRWEEVVVPAGRFRALRVDLDSQWRRLDKNSVGTAQWTYWYAPDVKRWVKATYQDSAERTREELLEFQVQ